MIRLQPEQLLAVLQEAGVSFVAVGGFALAAHGLKAAAGRDQGLIDIAELRRARGETLRAREASPSGVDRRPDDGGRARRHSAAFTTTVRRRARAWRAPCSSCAP